MKQASVDRQGERVPLVAAVVVAATTAAAAGRHGAGMD